jgi:Caspase domain
MWGLPPERSRTLLDCANTEELVGPLAEMANLARDTFIVYYSGHGVVGNDGDLVLPIRSTNLDMLKYTSLPYAWVRDIMGRCRAARRIVILDCCFSGRALRAMSDTAGAVIGQVDVDGIYVMTSAPANSVSLAPEDARNTAFTGGLLRVLRDGIPGLNERLSLDDLYDYTLMAMVRRGWPRPQRLGTNTIGRLGILRNRAWRKVFASARSKPPDDPARYRRLALAIREAVEIVTPTFGPTGQDGLDVLGRAFDNSIDSQADNAQGAALVRETMMAMREHHGDGATTSAIILGTLVDGLQSMLESGSGSGQLNAEISACTTRLTRRLLAGSGANGTSAEQLGAAVRTALGRNEIAEKVVAAAVAVGAGNVEVVPGSPDGTSEAGNAFVLETTVLAPNVASRPITLEDPLIVVSTDGEVDTRGLVAERGSVRSAVLIIAPRVSIFAVRSLLHHFSQVVVVRPTRPTFDLAALRDRLSQGADKPGWCRARRALVLADATTIDRPAIDLELSRNRVTLAVSDPAQLAIAERALAVARSVAEAGVVGGGGAALYAAAQAQKAGATDGSMAEAVLCAAACEPYRRLQLLSLSGKDAGRAVDSLATVRGALTHAVATTARFLSSEGQGA